MFSSNSNFDASFCIDFNLSPSPTTNRTTFSSFSRTFFSILTASRGLFSIEILQQYNIIFLSLYLSYALAKSSSSSIFTLLSSNSSSSTPIYTGITLSVVLPILSAISVFKYFVQVYVLSNNGAIAVESLGYSPFLQLQFSACI